MEFDIPLALTDLETAPAREGALFPKDVQDVSSMRDVEANELVERLTHDLCDNDATCIMEQEIFDRAYVCVRDFHRLSAVARIRLCDALCSNLSVLSSAAHTMLAAGAGADGADAVASHREALKCYSTLVYHLAKGAEADAANAGAAPPTEDPKSGKGKKGSKKTAPLAEWKWDEQRERVLHVMSGVLDVDLWNLFRPRQPPEGFLTMFTSLACAAMESQSALRSKVTKAAAFDMLGACALKWGQLENVTTSLLHLLNKHEHLPGPIAECAAAAADRHENARLAASLLREVGNVDPAEYKRQQLSDAVGVRCVGVFISELAERMPKTTMTNISLLLPHLDGEAYSLRSSLVTVLGRLLCSDASSGSLDRDQDRTTSDANAPLLRAKQGFLDLLVDRTHDVSAFTRARVLQTWSMMAEKKAIPLSHWLVVADLGIGRLGDKAALVRKAAMNLLATMLGFNPFAPTLPSAAFADSLAEYEAKLAAMAPPVTDEEESETDAFEKQMPETIEEGDEEDAEKPEGESAKEASDDENQNTEEPTEPEEKPVAGDADAAPELDGGVEAVRTMVAALKTALGFAVQMGGAVTVLCRLLASATPSDAIEATGLLVRLKQFGVDGADEGVRRMLGLVFSRDQSVRDAAVEAVDVLFLGGAESPMAAAKGLAHTASASALGELAAMEEILKLLVADNRVPPEGAVMTALWAQAGDKTDSEASRAAALTVLSMCAAKVPEIVGPRFGAVAAALDGACQTRKSSNPALARAAAAVLARARPGGNAGTSDSLGVCTPALPAAHPVFAALAKVLTPTSCLPGRGWYPCAEQSIAALYALHPDPEGAAADIVRSFAAAAFPTPAESEGGASNVNAAFLSRFLFVLGEVGLRHLVHVEGLARAVRRARVDRDRKAAESAEAAAAKGDDNSEEAALAAALGQGSVSEDLHLDNSRELAETELLAFKAAKGVGKGIVAAYAPVVVALCGHPAVAEGHALLRGAALAALSRLMAIDGVFCEEHLALIFTRLRRESDRGTRAALMVALGDLAFRFPNAVEPWTQHLYGVREWGNSLHDADAGVRQHAVTVLAHLVLNDMMKVKGHIAEMARCLEDPDPRVASVARLLFHELSRKHGNPIYNLLPDLLSRLSGDDQLTPDVFQKIMTRLLGFIDKDRQTESLADKFTNRFAEAALASTPKPARDVAFCLSQLSLSDKAFKKFMDGWKMYEPALYDKEVYAALNGVVAKAKKSYGGKSKSADGVDGAKQQVEEFEQKMNAAHVERYESWRTQKRAEGHVFDDDYEERLKAAEAQALAEAEAAAKEAEEEAHPLGPLDGETATAEKPEADEEAEEAEEADEEEDDEEEEEDEENDENDPEPSPAPAKKTSKRAAPKAKKAAEAVKEEAPTRSSRRALRANR